MDKLKDEAGYTLIESLTAIAVLGIFMFIVSALILKMFLNPKLVLRSEALLLANNEIKHTLTYKSSNDTTYTNANGNLIVGRRVHVNERINDVEVSVKMVSNPKVIVQLNASMKNE